MASRRVLIVDNDTTVLEFLSRWLTDAGYEVLRATDGHEAEQVMTQAASPEDMLLVIDVALTHESGIDVAETIAGSHASLRFLFISGFADAVVFSSSKFPKAKTAFLAKPFTRKQFVKAIETLVTA